ncbi:MAG: hypothetical protein IH849_12500 [Acidobacteria bacterium]|nr:hypothetical protein [Acidobacteriota bacterium]
MARTIIVFPSRSSESSPPRSHHELHTWTSVPEWGGQDVRIVLEQNVAMTEDRLVFLGGRQVEW